MTDPTTPTTFPVAKSLLARLERYAPPDECGGWHEWLDAVIEEARDGYVPASLSPEWHAELNLVAAEAAASALSALRAEVQHSIFGIGINEHALVRAAPRGVACLCGQYDDSDHGIEASLLWRSHLIESVRDHVLAAIDRLAKAEPEGESHDPDYMCPNCVTPWKCNGPHIPEGEPRG